MNRTREPGVLSETKRRRVLFRAVFFSAFFLSSTGCQGSTESAPQPDVGRIQRIGLRWIAERAEGPDSEKLATVAIAVSEEGRSLLDGGELPTPDHLTDFVQDSLGLRVRPFEELANKGEIQMRDAETGRAAAVLHVSRPTIQGPDEAQLYLGYLRGGHWAEGFRCSVNGGDEDWVIGECERIWIS